LKSQELIRVLRCSQKHDGTEIIHLDDIYSLNDNLQDKAFEKIFYRSLETKGMLNPILVSTEEGFKSTTHPFDRRKQPEHVEQQYRCMIGNNRYKYARENGYTHIECLVLDNLDELKSVHIKTFLEPRKM
jgi:hypothetical protein